MSRTSEMVDIGQLACFATVFGKSNQNVSISGILFFDGSHFLQVLEGGDEELESLFAKIARDARHTEVVLLLDEPIHATRFGPCGMQTHDLRVVRVAGDTLVLPSKRVTTVLRAFVNGLWHQRAGGVSQFTGNFSTSLATELSVPTPGSLSRVDRDDYSFAFQPIVDLERMTVSSYEALLRGTNGEAPATVLARKGEHVHRFDLESKGVALSLAAQLDCKSSFSVNLLPQSLLFSLNAVTQLIGYIESHGFARNQIIIEVTEEELIGDAKAFRRVIRELRSEGVLIAIDDFGAGYAGLSLLAEFQPSKLKIDRLLVQGIDSHGPRQSIVMAILDCCFRLGIQVVAEGVETMAELQWLYSAGVRRIQGFLLARPLTNGLPSIRWPQIVQQESATLNRRSTDSVPPSLK